MQDAGADNFWQKFMSRVGAIKDSLKALSPDRPDDSQKLMDIKSQCSQLQQYATDTTPLLPSYDIRRSQEELELLGKAIKETEAILKPKKKFSFASRTTTTSARALTAAVVANETVNNSSSAASYDPAGSYVLAGKIGETILLTEQELRAAAEEGQQPQLLIRECEGVTLSVKSVLGSARLENISNCTIYLAPCCTSVYLESCKNCTIFISCHQLRIHKSEYCQLYVRVNSHPIIEDSANMGFAPYSVTYEGIQSDFEASNLIDAKCWDNVVDFRWHRSTPSPHWHVIPPCERIGSIVGAVASLGWRIENNDNSHPEELDEGAPRKSTKDITDTTSSNSEINVEKHIFTAATATNSSAIFCHNADGIIDGEDEL